MILNPITNRKVKTNGPIGKIIHSCLNKISDRVVKRVILKELLFKKISSRKISSKFFIKSSLGSIDINNFRRTIYDFKTVKADEIGFRNCVKTIRDRGYIPKEYIGSGAVGSVYIACTKINSLKFNCKYIIKIQPLDSIYLTEKEVLKLTKKSSYTPTLYDSWTCKDSGFLVINRLVKCLKIAEKKEKIRNILDNLEKEYKILHLDTHRGNVMCDPKTKNIVLIDFGICAIKNRPDLLWHTNPIPEWNYNGKSKIPNWVWDRLVFKR